MTSTAHLPQTASAEALQLVILSGAPTSPPGKQATATVTINPGDGMPAFSIPAAARTFRGFREWALSEDFPQRGQITFSPEELIVDMSPESLKTHNYIKADISLVVHGLILRRELGRFIADRVLFSNERVGVSTEPDAMLISGSSLQSGRCSLVESKKSGVNIEVLGAPDWILEVVSPTSVRKDKVILREGYYRAGVGEYWIVDGLGDEIDFQILVPGKDNYRSVEPDDGWLASPTFGVSFLLSIKKDKNGFIQYVLHVKENT